MRPITFFAAVATLLCATVPSARAAQIAFDSAGDSAYNNLSLGFVPPGTNGGYGWGGGWVNDYNLRDGFNMSIGSSSTNGSGDPTGSGNINSPRTPLGRAWGIEPTISGNGVSGVTRAFSGQLMPGQTFMIDFDNGSLGRSEIVGIQVGDVALAAGAGYSFTDYILLAGGNQIDTGVAITDQGIHIELSIIDASTTRFSIAPLASPASGATFTFGQTTASSIEVINESGFGPSEDLYVNNMAITPEPATPMAWLAFLTPMLLRRSRF